MGNQAGDRADEGQTAGTAKRSAVVYAAAALAVLLVGAAIGMLITLSAVGRDDPPGADSVDVGFAQDMRTHHLQAITMAGWARNGSQDAEIRQLAFDIESTQLDQSGQFSGWLTAWGQPALAPIDQPHMRWMAGAAHGHGDGPAGTEQMPGMATSEELARLRNSTGAEFDVYFLQLMLRHHEGGLEMAAYAADHARLGYVRNMAAKIKQGQQAESTLLTDMLTARGSKPLPS
ncbi:Uncharacterized conserved protein, DUF305 family [Actinokineospora iranica]|uniref:Uncharacterized conserved protein, DUF305 family n=2 Tax=Actinokineospora iranica TaxID=1271860 RepID=A0A1G6M7J6_9PSEU|nr:Uncharacterized conserved protein, DUF305 family [Actinokineospora iranica]